MFNNDKAKVSILQKLLLFNILLSAIKKTKIIKIDNIFDESLYQNDMNFSLFKTKFKIMAIYYPDKYKTNANFGNKYLTESAIKRFSSINFNKQIIEQQIILAKNHGIFGFGIVYYLNYDKKIYDEIFYLFSFDDKNNFPFFIIINYEQKYDKNNYDENYNNINDKIFSLGKIKRYFKSKNYIKLEKKPILGIFHTLFGISKIISDIRKYEKENEIERIYISVKLWPFLCFFIFRYLYY